MNSGREHVGGTTVRRLQRCSCGISTPEGLAQELRRHTWSEARAQGRRETLRAQSRSSEAERLRARGSWTAAWENLAAAGPSVMVRKRGGHPCGADTDLRA